jgi:hypothetical protein
LDDKLDQRTKVFAQATAAREGEVVGMARANWAVLDSRCELSDG